MPIDYYQLEGTQTYVLKLKTDIMQTTDITGMERFRDDIEKKGERGIIRLVIHCVDETKVNSTSMAPIVSLCKILDPRVVFSNPSQRMRSMLSVYKLDTRFKIYQTMEEAVESFQT